MSDDVLKKRFFQQIKVMFGWEPGKPTQISDAAKQVIIDAGCEVYEPTAEELAAFQTAFPDPRVKDSSTAPLR